eukprot:2531310-Pyramimonas_sp.AAC.1
MTESDREVTERDRYRYGAQGLLKWFYLDALVSNGYSALYLDTDTIAVHDPFAVFEEDLNAEFDLMAMSDFSGSPSNRNYDEVVRKCPVRAPRTAE